jgi:hypothetical protein
VTFFDGGTVCFCEAFLCGQKEKKTSAPLEMENEPRSLRVRRMVAEIEEALKTETPAQVSSRFSEYQTEFPKIFELLLTRTYRREILEMMLRNLEKMESGSLSQHNASVAVGGVLVEEYVKPQLNGSKK